MKKLLSLLFLLATTMCLVAQQPPILRNYYDTNANPTISPGGITLVNTMVTNSINAIGSSGRVIYIAPWGNDTNPGTFAAPFQTFHDPLELLTGAYKGAHTVVRTNDLVYIMGGVYSNTLNVIPLPDYVHLWIDPGAVIIRGWFTNLYLGGGYNPVHAAMINNGPLLQPGNNSKIYNYGTIIATNNDGAGYDAPIGWFATADTFSPFLNYGYTNHPTTNWTITGSSSIGSSDSYIFIHTNLLQRGEGTIRDARANSGWDGLRISGPTLIKTFNCEFFGNAALSQPIFSKGTVALLDVQAQWEDYGSKIGVCCGTNDNYPLGLFTGASAQLYGTKLYRTTFYATNDTDIYNPQLTNIVTGFAYLTPGPVAFGTNIFTGNGAGLTNIPTSGAGTNTIDQVLRQGDTAIGQNLTMRSADTIIIHYDLRSNIFWVNVGMTNFKELNQYGPAVITNVANVFGGSAALDLSLGGGSSNLTKITPWIQVTNLPGNIQALAVMNKSNAYEYPIHIYSVGNRSGTDPATNMVSALMKFDYDFNMVNNLFWNPAINYLDVSDTNYAAVEIEAGQEGYSAHVYAPGSRPDGTNFHFMFQSRSGAPRTSIGNSTAPSGAYWNQMQAPLYFEASLSDRNVWIYTNNSPSRAFITMYNERSTVMDPFIFMSESDASSSFGPNFVVRKSAGNINNPAITTSVMRYFAFQCFGHDGSGWGESARFEAGADGTPVAGSIPGKFTFSVALSGTTNPTPAMVLDAAKTLSVSNNINTHGVFQAGASLGLTTNIWVMTNAINGALLQFKGGILTGVVP